MTECHRTSHSARSSRFKLTSSVGRAQQEEALIATSSKHHEMRLAWMAVGRGGHLWCDGDTLESLLAEGGVDFDLDLEARRHNVVA